MTLETPAQLFPGYEFVAAGGTVPADSVVIPLADLHGFTAAEADAATGSAPALLHGIMKTATDAHNALASAARSPRLDLTRATPAGAGNNLVNVTHTLRVTLDIANADVAAEP